MCTSYSTWPPRWYSAIVGVRWGVRYTSRLILHLLYQLSIVGLQTWPLYLIWENLPSEEVIILSKTPVSSPESPSWAHPRPIFYGVVYTGWAGGGGSLVFRSFTFTSKPPPGPRSPGEDIDLTELYQDLDDGLGAVICVQEGHWELFSDPLPKKTRVRSSMKLCETEIVHLSKN